MWFIYFFVVVGWLKKLMIKIIYKIDDIKCVVLMEFNFLVYEILFFGLIIYIWRRKVE